VKPLRPADGVRLLALAVLYVLTARVGLALDAVGGFATVVWAPTGLSLAALVLFGIRLAPGVFVGALAANLLTGAPIAAAIGVAIGNTLEAIVGALVLRRLQHFRPQLDRLSDALALFFVAMGAPLVSASIGVATLTATNTVPASQAAEAWRAWWLGDCIGALLVAPLILVWHRGAQELRALPRSLEAIALLASTVVVSWLIFFERTPIQRESFLQAYVVFPLMIWAAVRFGQRGGVTAAFATSFIALLGTVKGLGPFERADLHSSLFALQTFMGIVAACFLVLGATISEREQVRREALNALEGEARANRAKADFIAVMSHELRTPLNAISGHVDLLLKGEITTQQRHSLQAVQRVQAHVATLVDDVLNYSRLEAGPIVMHSSIVKVNEMFDSIEPVLQPELRRKRLSLDRTSLERGLSVVADPERLRQVLLNVVTNAVKYTPDGGSVGLGAERENGKVRIAVKDSGVGIPADALARVFEPFYQVDRGPGARIPGVGLGLAIARDLTRAMRGELTIESTVGSGTTVSVLLPPG
jgi:signal transduction histidine kinase